MSQKQKLENWSSDIHLFFRPSVFSVSLQGRTVALAEKNSEVNRVQRSRSNAVDDQLKVKTIRGTWTAAIASGQRPDIWVQRRRWS